MAKKVATKKAAKKAAAKTSSRSTSAKKVARETSAGKKAAAAKQAVTKKKEKTPAKKPATAGRKDAPSMPARGSFSKKARAEATAAPAAPALSAAEKKKAAKAKVEAIRKAAAAEASKKPVKLTPFLKKQHKRLLDLRDTLVDAMAGVAQDNLRSRAEGSEASAFGMHQADAGSDAYDRDFALNLLSQEQDALYEIEEALKRVMDGTYGVCEVSGSKISKARLEAIPFARLTVECQAEVEREQRNGYQRQSVRSLFGLNEDEGSELTTADALEEDKK